ncbi:MAG: glycosyltransferase, partial [Deltaproteobacteria bacterium]|nr:glycosyltransferase [Deltaproteobacteria bacterium]
MKPDREKVTPFPKGGLGGIKVSVTIITLNEEANIRDCLESVGWADEVIVSDSGSTDRTVEICRGYGAKVYNDDWRGFGKQKNL